MKRPELDPAVIADVTARLDECTPPRPEPYVEHLGQTLASIAAESA